MKSGKPPILINTDRLPDNSDEQRKWVLRQRATMANLKTPKSQGGFRFELLRKVAVASCVGVDGAPIAYVISGFFKDANSWFPLRYHKEFTQRACCWPFLEEFTVKRRAECAAVLLARRLGVRVAKGIAESISEADLAFYYPVESKEGSEA